MHHPLKEYKPRSQVIQQKKKKKKAYLNKDRLRDSFIWGLLSRSRGIGFGVDELEGNMQICFQNVKNSHTEEVLCGFWINSEGLADRE